MMTAFEKTQVTVIKMNKIMGHFGENYYTDIENYIYFQNKYIEILVEYEDCTKEEYQEMFQGMLDEYFNVKINDNVNNLYKTLYNTIMNNAVEFEFLRDIIPALVAYEITYLINE